MESINNPANTSSPVPYSQPLPDATTKPSIFKAATVQMLVSQPAGTVLAAHKKMPAPLAEAGTALANRKTELNSSACSVSNYEPQSGPQYRLNDRKETSSGAVWELDKSIKIRGVDYEKWPLQLSPAQVKAYFESGRAVILNTTPDSPDAQPAAQQDSRRPIPNLDLLLPESDTRRSWFDYFYRHPGQVVEDALAQAFGTEGARYLRNQLDQLSTDNEQVQQWKEVCKLLSAQATSSFPYRPSPNSPTEGKGENIILEMMFIQENTEEDPATNGKARRWRIKMGNFLKNAGLDGDLAYIERRIETYRGGFNAMDQSVLDGAVQFFLTTTQARQLFTSLRLFVTGQVSGSIE